MFRPKVEDKSMSVHALRVAKTLTQWEAVRSNLKWPDARAAVARKAGLKPGALERLEKGTLVFIERIERRLDDLLIETGERQIAAIKHEMALARARGQSGRKVDLASLEAAIEQAERALGKH